MIRPFPEPEPSWTAFRYALGELPDAEAAAFERRLLDDQAAREAVALAVELVGALAIVGAEQPSPLPAPVRDRRRRFAPWAPLATAAAVFAAALAWTGQAPRPGPDASRVASAWSGLRDRPGPDLDDELPGPIEAEPTLDRPLPSWLVAGAAGPVEDPPRVED